MIKSNKKSRREEKLENLRKIFPVLKETFEKRKRLEVLKKTISVAQNKVKSKERLIPFLEKKETTKLEEDIQDLIKQLKKEITELSDEIAVNQNKVVELGNEIVFEEAFYQGPAKLLKGVKARKEELQKNEDVLLLYLMWMTKTQKEEFFVL